MLIKHIARIPEFAHLNQTELRAVAGSARILCLPAARWVVKNAKDIGAYLYLLRGSVQTWSPDRCVPYAPLGRLEHIYPGCRSMQTRVTCQLLLIDASQREFLMDRGLGHASIDGACEPWLAKFLNSHLMQLLTPHHWHQLLRVFRRMSFAQGQAIVQYQARGTSCFVIEAGHAVVHRDDRTLCYLSPGDMFGEDALISGCARSASITALEEMQVHAISADAFKKFLLEPCVQAVTACGEGHRLRIGTNPEAGEQVISMLDLRASLDQLVTPRKVLCGGWNLSATPVGCFSAQSTGYQSVPIGELSRYRSVLSPAA